MTYSGTGIWTLSGRTNAFPTGGGTTYYFCPGPANVRENWTRNIMDFDVPYFFHHILIDWVSTAKDLTITGSIVDGQLDQNGVAHSLTWWKKRLGEIMYVIDLGGMDTAQNIYTLCDNYLDSETADYSFGNSANKYVLATGLEWTQEGGVVSKMDYKLTLQIGVATF